jgi:hypothetical protein
MHWKSFFSGFGIAAVLMAVACGWVIFKVGQQPIIMGLGFDLYDAKAQLGHGYITFSGALGGGEMHTSNIFTGTCREIRMTCETADVAQIAPHQVGHLYTDVYYVTKWTPEIIEAQNGPDWPTCVTIRIVVHRQTKLVEYIRSPRAAKMKGCEQVEQRTIGRVIGEPDWNTPIPGTQ